jgi:hypothetical protein
VKFTSDDNLLNKSYEKLINSNNPTSPTISVESTTLTRTTVSNYTMNTTINEIKNTNNLYKNKHSPHINYITIKHQYQTMR